MPVALGGVVDLFERRARHRLAPVRGRPRSAGAPPSSARSNGWRRTARWSSRSTTRSGSTRPRPARSATRSAASRRSGSECSPTARPGGDRRRRRLAATRIEMVELGPFGLARSPPDARGHGRLHPRPTLRRIHEASGGNPLFALELARGLASWDTAAGTRRGGAASRVAPGRDRPAGGVGDGRAPSGARDSLGARPSSTEELRAALPDTDVDPLLPPAAEYELLVVEDGAVRFAHPLVGSVVYARLGPIERRASTVASRAAPATRS